VSRTQRLLRAWPAIVLIIACVVGLVTTHWSPARSAPRGGRNSSDTRSSSSKSAAHSPQGDDLPVEEPLINPVPASLAQEETDLSKFPPQAWNHSSLIYLPSPLVPEQWSVQTDVGDLQVNRVFADPLLLTMQHFLTAEECEGLVRDAKAAGFVRSLTTRGVVETRTSSSSYLPHNNPLRLRMMARAANITGEPMENMEVGPVIEYEIGQKFDEHWDSTRDETFGRRLTFFVPLSSVPEEDGGHTAFTLLRVRFPPKNGSAIIWRNFVPKAIYDDFDRRMKHAGEPPKRGYKYAINIWIYKEKYIHWSERDTTPAPDIAFPAAPRKKLAATPAPVDLDLLPLQPPNAVRLLTLPIASLRSGWKLDADVGELYVERLHPEHMLLRVGDFLALSERQQLLREAAKAGWVPSETVAGFSSSRTSSTAWLFDTAIQDVVQDRIAALAGVPSTWVEANALTRYRVGEFYLPHWDSQKDAVPDRRITVHITLAVEPDEKMGHVRFPSIDNGLTVPPRAGTALLWRNYRINEFEHDATMLHGFDAPQQGDIYTLTCFVFPSPQREPKPKSRPEQQSLN